MKKFKINGTIYTIKNYCENVHTVEKETATGTTKETTGTLEDCEGYLIDKATYEGATIEEVKEVCTKCKQTKSTTKGLQVYELIKILEELEQDKVIFLCGGTEWNFYQQFDNYSIDTEDNEEYGKKI